MSDSAIKKRDEELFGRLRMISKFKGRLKAIDYSIDSLLKLK